MFSFIQRWQVRKALKNRNFAKILADKNAYFDCVLSMLNETNHEIRYAACAVLGDFKDSRAVLPITKLLDSKDHLLVSGAIRSLATIGDKKAVQGLIKALKDKRHGEFEEAANKLGELGDPSAIVPLIECAHKWNHPHHAYPLIKLLQKIRETHSDVFEKSMQSIVADVANAYISQQQRAKEANLIGRMANILTSIMWEPSDIQHKIARCVALYRYKDAAKYGQQAAAILKLEAEYWSGRGPSDSQIEDLNAALRLIGENPRDCWSYGK